MLIAAHEMRLLLMFFYDELLVQVMYQNTNIAIHGGLHGSMQQKLGPIALRELEALKGTSMAVLSRTRCSFPA